MIDTLRVHTKVLGWRARLSTTRASLWTVIDQGIASAGTFLTFVILARHLEPEAYGLFSLVFGVLAVLNNLHSGLVVYPIMMRIAGANGEVRSTCTQGLSTTLLLALPQVAILGTACGFAGVSAAWPIAALLAWQCQETLRRTFIAQSLPAEAVPGDAVSYFGQIVLIAWMSVSSIVTVEQVFAAIACTSLLAASIQALQLRPAAVPAQALWRAAGEFLHMGRWASINGILGIATPQLFLWIVAFRSGAPSAAALQALVSIVSAINPVMFGMGNVVVSEAGKSMTAGNLPEAVRVCVRYTMHGSMLVSPYLLLLVLAPGAVLALVYGASSPYSQLPGSLRLCALYGCLLYLAHLAGMLLYGMGRSNLVSRAYAASVILIILTVPIIMIGGVPAAILSLSATAMIRLAFHLGDLVSIARSSPDSGSVAILG